MSLRCAVLDRDGTLIRHVPYLSDPAQVELLPTVIEGVRLLRDAGVMLVLHSNQSGVGRGMFALSAVEACNSAMVRQLGFGDGVFTRVCIAPETPDQPAIYRKPEPKLGNELMKDYSLTADELCYIGDNVTDLLTAKNVGCRGIGVATGGHPLREQVAGTDGVRDFPVFDAFIDAASFALRGKH